MLRISFSNSEIRNIEASYNHLKHITVNHDSFTAPFLGGSFKRGTMVKGISDIDLYCFYTGAGNPQAALSALKNHLSTSYPNTIIKQDKPCILLDFNKIPFDVTPLKKENDLIRIPTKDLLSWYIVNLEVLEKAIILLKNKSPLYLDLIKILKLWNRNYGKNYKNYELELIVSSIFLPYSASETSISKALLTFFKHKSIHDASAKMTDLIYSRSSGQQLNNEWLNFIDKR